MTVVPQALRAVSPSELAARIDLERRGVAFVVYLDGDRRQRLVELGDDVSALCIGRRASSDIAIPWDPEVSRTHALLERVGGQWTLTDDGLSHNGTYVNGRRIRGRRRLDDGDVIAVGHTVLAFAGGADASARTATAIESRPPALSPAQRRVLAELCRPFAQGGPATPPSNREIAERLFLSVETVKTHLRDLFEAFELPAMPQNRKRTELVRRALARGAVTDEQR